MSFDAWSFGSMGDATPAGSAQIPSAGEGAPDTSSQDTQTNPFSIWDPRYYAFEAAKAAAAAAGVASDAAGSASDAVQNAVSDPFGIIKTENEISAEIKQGAVGVALYIILAIGLFALVWPGAIGQASSAVTDTDGGKSGELDAGGGEGSPAPQPTKAKKAAVKVAKVAEVAA